MRREQKPDFEVSQQVQSPPNDAGTNTVERATEGEQMLPCTLAGACPWVMVAPFHLTPTC